MSDYFSIGILNIYNHKIIIECIKDNNLNIDIDYYDNNQLLILSTDNIKELIIMCTILLKLDKNFIELFKEVSKLKE